ncbi:MAG: MarR family transcriptional regulator [Microbacterium sp.]|uniref:MarR family winged helix-turn-helix transcriptional regulator n=1 Tax=Microbacterium sp. TaxID=51671 RepID=UPI0039E54F62
MSETVSPAVSDWLSGPVFRLWKADQLLSRAVTAALEGIGATITHVGILVHLDGLGPLSASDLARLLSLTPQSTTAALAQLEELGWTVRAPHPTHRRVVLHEVTEAGRAIAADGRHRVGAVGADVDALLRADDRAAAYRATAALIPD